MKNINIIIYLALGLIILVLIGALVYLEKNNMTYIERIAVLEKENEFKPLGEITLKSILDKLNADSVKKMNEDFQAYTSDDMLKNFDDKNRYCGTEQDIFRNYMQYVMESLGDVNTKAQLQSFESIVSSTQWSVYSCMVEKGFINSPKEDEFICQGELDKWPGFSTIEGVANWGGCDFEIDKTKETFKYCATFGEIKAVCTQDGCNF